MTEMSSNSGQQTTTTLMKSNRDVHWTMVAVGTTIALVALFDDGGELNYDYGPYLFEAYFPDIRVPMLISLLLAWCAVFTNMFARTKFVDTIGEGVISSIVCGSWAVVMPTLTYQVTNANLFSFAWLSFIVSFVTLVNFVRSRFNIRFNISTALCSVFTPWAVLTMTSLVVLVSAVSLGRMCKIFDRDYTWYTWGICPRTIFAISIGTIGWFVSITWMLIDLLWTSVHKQKIKLVLGLVMFTAWIFGVGFVTFGYSSPGHELGILHFFTWGSSGVSLYILLQAWQAFKEGQAVSDESENNIPSDGGQIVADEEKGSTAADNMVADKEKLISEKI